MFDPFSAWSRILAAGCDIQTTWWQGLETLQASGSVIGARSEKMREALRSPLRTDVTELGRMVPEKVDAFSRSAGAIARDTIAIQTAWAGQMQHFWLIMASGKLPSPSEAALLANRTADYALGAVSAGAKLGKSALAPIHRTATGNARRLKRGGKR